MGTCKSLKSGRFVAPHQRHAQSSSSMVAESRNKTNSSLPLDLKIQDPWSVSTMIQQRKTMLHLHAQAVSPYRAQEANVAADVPADGMMAIGFFLPIQLEKPLLLLHIHALCLKSPSINPTPEHRH